jgi:hypothetical protein
MLGSLLLLGGLVLGQAEAKTPWDALAVEVRKLIRQLDAPKLEQRDAAEAELVKLGPNVLDLLPKDVDPSQAEVAQRVARIRQKLERSVAESAVQASRVTLHGKMPLSKILAAIEQQTGNKIVDVRRGAVANLPDPEVQVDFEKTPFWQALDQVLDQVGLTVYPYGESKTVQVVKQPGEEGLRSKRACYQGPFRFEAVSIVAERDLRNRTGGTLKLEVEVTWEPRVEPVSFSLKMADVKAVDDRGKPVPVETKEAVPEIPVEAGPIGKKIILPLSPPARDVKQIARLSGRLNAIIPGKMETFRFKDLAQAKNVERRAAGVTVVLEEVVKNNKVWEVLTLLRFDNAGESLASHRTWVYNNPAYLEGPDGKPVERASLETTKQTENEVGMGYLFVIEGGLEGYTFVYKTPAMVFSTPVEYELRDIPLP